MVPPFCHGNRGGNGQGYVAEVSYVVRRKEADLSTTAFHWLNDLGYNLIGIIVAKGCYQLAHISMAQLNIMRVLGTQVNITLAIGKCIQEENKRIQVLVIGSCDPFAIR
jgi:hypothetical protein